jgi:hypothetical protein
MVYVIQLDAGDMDRFRVEGVVDSDIPPQVKNVRQVRIEYAPLFPVPPVQALLPKEAPPSPPPLPSRPSEPTKRSTQLPIGPRTKTSGPEAVKTPDFLLSPDERKKGKAKEKEAAPAGKSGHEATTGTQGEPPPHGAAVPRPWLPFIIVGLCTSVAGNVYFCWMWIETRGRYRRLAQRQRTTGEVSKDQ